MLISKICKCSSSSSPSFDCDLLFSRRIYRYKSMNCTGRCIRNTNLPEAQQFNVSKEHTHAPDARILGKASAINDLKRRAKDTIDSGRNIVSKVCRTMDVATAAAMPTTTALLRTVRRARKENNCPKTPNTLKDLELPKEYTLYNEEPFLVYDSGPIDDRILIYCTKRNLEFHNRADTILMDGTFNIVPPLFSQLYTIQGIKFAMVFSTLHICT